MRYSIINPNKYLDVNILGFINLIKIIENKKIKKFIYASSSSVYGDSKKFPLKETNKLNPKNIYALSKKMNEELADYEMDQNIVNHNDYKNTIIDDFKTIPIVSISMNENDLFGSNGVGI